MKKRILLVGEHPFAYSGNAGMLRGLLSTIDKREYDPCVFTVGEAPEDINMMAFNPMANVSLVKGNQPNDPWGKGRLINLMGRVNFHIVLFVGLDIWRYGDVFDQIRSQADKKRFKIAFLFPYDLQMIRPDWVKWIRMVDYPCVYSQYGYDILKKHVPNIRYFRPELDYKSVWKIYPENDVQAIKRKWFPNIRSGAKIIGFIGPNQYRKDPQGMLRAFAIMQEKNHDLVLYMHTDISQGQGVYNLHQTINDLGIDKKRLVTKAGGYYNVKDMAMLLNCIDVYVNCSLQEGLSWVPIQAMLCGTPVVLSDTTAHPELVGEGGRLIKCETPCEIPVITATGHSLIPAKKCDPQDIADAVLDVVENREEHQRLFLNGIEKGKEWVAGISNVNELLNEIIIDAIKETEVATVKNVTSLEANEWIMFAQKASAGDVLMTTRCFKGLKERHPECELHYMTSRPYIALLDGNPFIDKVIEWDGELLQSNEYKRIYNPHGERILPGHWGRNSNSTLSNFYWKLLNVKPDAFFILPTEPDVNIDTKKKICVFYTTGQDKHCRTYRYMDDVCKLLGDRYYTIQLGGLDDVPAGADLDLRGMTFREEAWVVKEKANLGIAVDTFGAHLLGAHNVPTVMLPGSSNGYVVRPTMIKGAPLEVLSPDYLTYCRGLGPCSGSIHDCDVPCMGRVTPREIVEAVDRIEEVLNAC